MPAATVNSLSAIPYFSFYLQSPDFSVFLGAFRHDALLVFEGLLQLHFKLVLLKYEIKTFMIIQKSDNGVNIRKQIWVVTSELLKTTLPLQYHTANKLENPKPKSTKYARINFC